MDKRMDQIGADQVVNALEKLQVKTIFGIPGIHNLDIYDSLLSSDINHITARHEQGAGFMADGYARINNEPGVCLVISGPGLTNIITPMGQAMADSIPMVVISSQLPTSSLGQGTGSLHELDNSTYLAESVAKESKRIMHKDKIVSGIEEAYQLAMSGRPGPVHIEIPMDILQTPIFNTKLTNNNYSFSCDPWENLDQEDQINSTVKLLKKAEQSIIIAGGGSTQAGEELKHIIEKIEIPVVQTIAGKGVIREDHPLCLGASMIFDEVQEKIKNSDCVLAVGTEIAPTDLEGRELNIEGTLVQIDMDAGNFQRNFIADIEIRGDASRILKRINHKLEDLRIGNYQEKEEIIEHSKKELMNLRGMDESKVDFTLNMLKAMRKAVPRDGVLVADMTTPAYVARNEYPAFQPNTFLHPVGYGTLGYALPAAIGVKFADMERDVAVLAGDGGFQFTIQELGVLLENEMSLPIIIWNNDGFGEIRKNELKRHPNETIAVDHKNPDFKKLATSYNLSYSQIKRPSKLESTLKEAFNKSKPEIIEVLV